MPLTAQNSSLQGTVTDDHGAVVAGSSRHDRQPGNETAAKRGLERIPGPIKFVQVPPGTYSLEVQKPGFKTHASKMVLQVSTPATLNVKLEVGQVTETSVVTDEVAQVNTQNATIGNPFTETQIKQLPLQTRNIVELLGLQPASRPPAKCWVHVAIRTT